MSASPLVGYLSFINGQKAVQKLVNSLEGEISDRIQEHLTDYLEKPHTIARLNAGAAQLGKLHPADLPATQRYFWQQMQIFSSVRDIYLGSKEGVLIRVRREESGQFVARITENFPQRSYYALDDQGNPTNLLSFEPNYDPRVRPWYISATAEKKLVWMEIYTFFKGDLGITAAQPFYDDRGDFVGVMAVDLILSQIGDFLGNMKISRSGQTFIMERSAL